MAKVYGIVKQHRGFINVETERGKGTTFRVYLPASGGIAESLESRGDERPRRGSETILLAEDHDAPRQSAQEMLEALCYRVIVAANGLDAIGIFKASPQQVDLVVLDVIMAGLSGPDTYLQMASIRSDLRVVFTTGYTSEAASLSSLIDKGAGFLQKPYSLHRMSVKIRDVLDRVLSSS